MADPELIQAIVDFIASYRGAEAPPQRMLEAVLAEFPKASSSDYAIGLAAANQRRRPK